MNFFTQFWYMQTWGFVILYAITALGWGTAIVLTILHIKKPKKIARQIDELNSLIASCQREQSITLQQIEHLEELNRRYTMLRNDIEASTLEQEALQEKIKTLMLKEKLEREDKSNVLEEETTKKGEQVGQQGTKDVKADNQLPKDKKAVKGQKNGSK